MGKYVTNNKVTITLPYDKDNVVSEIAQMLGVTKRNDGRYHLADICQATSINANARKKPEDYNTVVNLTDAQRAANNYGFGTTVPSFKAGYAEVPHAVYEYKQPKGTDTSRNRLLDFNGYFHDAASPLSLIFPAKLYYDWPNAVSIRANDTGVINYNVTDCVKLGDVMHANNDLYVALYIHKNSSSQWLLPTNVRVNELSSSIFPQIVFGRSASELPAQTANVYPYVLPDIGSSNGQSYTLVAVAVNGVTYQTDKTPFAVGSSKPIGDRLLYSMELTYGADRKLLPITTAKTLDGLTGSFVAGITVKKITTPSQYGSYPTYEITAASSTLSVQTPSEWMFTSQDKIYIRATISTTGYTLDRQDNNDSWTSVWTATLGSAGTTYTNSDMLNMWGNYKFVDISNSSLTTGLPFTIVIYAYKDQTYTNGKLLYSGTVNAIKL